MAWKVSAALSAVLLASVTIACSPIANDAKNDESNITEAADATGAGPFEMTSAEYKLPASVDPDIIGDRQTEIWARMWRPTTMTSGEKHPLIVFLHGNHGTCGTGSNPRVDDNTQYTTSGTCPAGYIPTPNHMGYAYIAERLASWGYIVVSINANRGITAGAAAPGDNGVNLARGRLILKHLQLLSQWNAQAGSTPASLGVDLAGMIDFDNVGMMGHSRGGEGVRAAYTQYHDSGSPWPSKILSPVGVKAIFEIGPVDGQTSRTLNALGTAWNVVLPMCDGDVSNLQGMKPFDRMMAASAEDHANPKGLFAVWGANHNYFNTEWQQSDSHRCGGVNQTPLFDLVGGPGIAGSAKQQTVGLYALMGFFRSHVGANAQAAFNNAYDPQFGLPAGLSAVTHIERAYSDAADASQMTVLEDFTKANGTSLSGAPEVLQGATVTHGGVAEHDAVLRAANVKWTAASADSFYQIPFNAAGVDASTMKTFDFRISRQASGTDAAAEINFDVRLVGLDGTLSSPVALKDYLTVAQQGGHTILESARLPLSAFTGVDLSKVAGVRYVFDGSTSGAVYLANLRFSRAAAASAPVTQGDLGPIRITGAPSEPVQILTGNSVADLRNAPGSDDVEVEVASQAGFPVSDDLTHLQVDGQDVVASRYADDGNTGHMIFRMTAAQFAAAHEGSALRVQYGEEAPTRQYAVGSLNKTSLRR